MAGHECDEALHELYGYLDGELTVERRAIITQHLDDCPPCGDFYEFEAELRVVIARKCAERVPESLKQRIAEALSKEVGQA
jgi:mycothiol system anti-sigma-R factor